MKTDNNDKQSKATQLAKPIKFNALLGKLGLGASKSFIEVVILDAESNITDISKLYSYRGEGVEFEVSITPIQTKTEEENDGKKKDGKSRSKGRTRRVRHVRPNA